MKFLQIASLLVLAFLVSLGLGHFRELGLAHADGSGSAVLDAGTSADAGVGSAVGSASGAGTGSAAAPVLTDNPVAHPGDALTEFEAAKKLGWSVGLLAALILALRGLGALNVPWLAFLKQGKTAAIIAMLGAVAVAAYNALASGGSLYAVAAAAVVAFAHLFDAKPAPSMASAG